VVLESESKSTQGVKVRRPKTNDFPAWDEAGIEAYERRWPIGTRERVMFDIFRWIAPG
jgi:hypothetical protein